MLLLVPLQVARMSRWSEAAALEPLIFVCLTGVRGGHVGIAEPQASMLLAAGSQLAHHYTLPLCENARILIG